MTIVERKDYDPINPFWFPICGEDIKSSSTLQTIYLMAGEDGLKEFSKLETVNGVDEASGRTIRFQIRKTERYEEAVKRLYQLLQAIIFPGRAYIWGIWNVFLI